jgi:hypothetical protein
MRPSPFRSSAIALFPALALALAAGTTASGPAPAVPPRALGLQAGFTVLPWSPAGADTEHYFGQSVAPAGDVDGDGDGDLLVGAFAFEPGLVDAQLFLGSPDGPSGTPAWSWNSGQRGGYSVSSAGDVNADGFADVLVGLPFWTQAGQTARGRVAVFHGGPAGLPAVPTYDLVSPTPAAGQQFGFAVAPAGDVNGDGFADVIVGADLYSAAGFTGRGAAFVFHGGASGLAAAPARTLVGPADTNARFGAAVATAGDLNGDGFADVIAGAPNGTGNVGKVALHLGSAGGVLAAADTVLTGPGNAALFGWTVSTAGDVDGDDYTDVLIGAPGFDTARGRAQLLFGGPQGIESGMLLFNPVVAEHERFGTCVATAGDLDGDGFADFAVSALNSGTGNQGRVSVFFGGFDGPTWRGEVYPPNPSEASNFGESVAASGDVDGDGFGELLVGDPFDGPGDTYRGRAHLFAAPRSQPFLADDWPQVAAQPGTRYGSALAILPHPSGSDFASLAIGDPQFDGVGRLTLHAGFPPQGVSPIFSGSMAGGTTFQGFGARIVDAGDMNGDGYTDFAVSSPTVDAGAVSQAGRVDLVNGDQPGSLPAPVPVIAGGRDFDRVGSALAGRGDVNGDGYHDLLIGAREWDSATLIDCGKAWLFLGGPTGPGAVAAWSREGSSHWQGLGHSVALTDFDGDGYSDVVVGSSTPPSGGTPQPGRVEVFYGRPAGPPAVPGLVLDTRTAETSFGATVAAVGDVTGDAIADLAVGAPAENETGIVRIYPGTLGRSQSDIAAWSVAGTQDGGRFGEAIAGGGDVDGDGIADLVVGEPGWDGSFVDEGRIHLFHGASPVPAEEADWSFVPNIVGAELGAAFAPLVDVSGDGFADVVAGAPGGAGRVYPFLGGGGQGRRLVLLLHEPFAGALRRFHPAKLAHENVVAAGLTLRMHGAGRIRISYQAEIALQNEVFTGQPTHTDPTTFDVGLAGQHNTLFPTLPHGLPGRALHVRARLVSSSPFFQRTRWITDGAHASGDHDVRAGGAVVAAPGEVAGAGVPRLVGVSPNPSPPATPARFAFSLPRRARVALDLYDVRGARVRRLLDNEAPAGANAWSWDGRDEAGRMAPAGLYFAVLRAEGRMDRARLVRLP